MIGCIKVHVDVVDLCKYTMTINSQITIILVYFFDSNKKKHLNVTKIDIICCEIMFHVIEKRQSRQGKFYLIVIDTLHCLKIFIIFLLFWMYLIFL